MNFSSWKIITMVFYFKEKSLRNEKKYLQHPFVVLIHVIDTCRQRFFQALTFFIHRTKSANFQLFSNVNLRQLYWLIFLCHLGNDFGTKFFFVIIKLKENFEVEASSKRLGNWKSCEFYNRSKLIHRRVIIKIFFYLNLLNQKFLLSELQRMNNEY